jgi:thymidylate synthase
MMDVLTASSISDAWLEAARLLQARPGKEAWDLAVEIRQPNAPENTLLRESLDDRLQELEAQSIDTVANTIFPQALWDSSHGDRERFYSRYRRMIPKLRRFPGNRRGLYFERLISWPSGEEEPYNQVEHVIQRMQRQLAGSRPLRFVYDLAIHSPVRDAMPRGFPCLAYVNIKLAARRLHMTAHYRNHYFVERAYGNYIGLARLQNYIAGAAGVDSGRLICISGHAWLDHDISKLLAQGAPVSSAS